MTAETAVRVGPDAVQVIAPDRPEDTWLAARGTGVGASEVAAVLGESKYDSPYSLFARKTGRVQPEPRTKVQKRGQRFEALIAEAFADDHPEYQVTDVGLVQNLERPWEIATPDRLLLVNGEAAGLLECKTAGFGKVADWGEEGTDDIPVAYALQVHWQLGVTGLPYAWVACMFSLDDRRDYLIRRDDDVIAYLREKVYAFWHDHVLADVPPAVDGHEATKDALRAVPTTDEPVELGDEVRKLCADYWQAHREAEAAETRKNLAGNRLRELLNGSTAGAVGGQVWVTNKTQAGKRTFDFDRFQADHPDLAPLYVKRGHDFPVLRPRKVGLDA